MSLVVVAMIGVSEGQLPNLPTSGQMWLSSGCRYLAWEWNGRVILWTTGRVRFVSAIYGDDDATGHRWIGREGSLLIRAGPSAHLIRPETLTAPLWCNNICADWREDEGLLRG